MVAERFDSAPSSSSKHTTMVAVYFGMESQKYAELVANFDSEEVYLACLPALEKLAKKNGFDHVTESIEPESSLWESPNWRCSASIRLATWPVPHQNTNHMETLGISGIVSHDQVLTQKYNQLLRLIGTEGMLTQFERFIDHEELEGLITQVEENLLENNIKY